MYFEKCEKFPNMKMAYISHLSGGYISRNQHILNNLNLNELTLYILEKTVYGTPVFKLGDGGDKVLLISGIHGNELPPQLAGILLLNKLYAKNLKNTYYFIPFATPKSTMNNERTFNSMDLNRSAHIKNSLSNLIIEFAVENQVNCIGDFHSSAYNSNPGREAIFSSKNPSPESFVIANYVSQKVGSEIIAFELAGSKFRGAVEDVSNLNGIPAITAEVLSPFASVGQNSVERSLMQMFGFLNYFEDMTKI